jgi:putative flippase GtrA
MRPPMNDSRAKVRQLATFAAVGLFNTLGYILFANGAHLYLHLDQTMAAYFAYAIMVPLSFFGHRRLTFSSDGPISTEWLKFCLVQATNLLVIWCVTMTSSHANVAGWVAFAVISVLIPVSNFVIFQLWVFAKRL